MIDPVARKSVVHCFSAANSPIGPYGPIEIVLMMTFDEAVSVLKQTRRSYEKHAQYTRC